VLEKLRQAQDAGEIGDRNEALEMAVRIVKMESPATAVRLSETK
jgi:hypothetical protein